eukprot:scaffold164674_cov35-Attheya_sp.AAC.1
MACGFTPRKKARFAPELVEGAKAQHSFCHPARNRNQQQLVDLVERMRSGTAQLAKELSNDMDSADVRFDRVERMLGEWPDEFATSQLCTMSSNLAEDVDKILASAEDS